jgi:hypothetical protein
MLIYALWQIPQLLILSKYGDILLNQQEFGTYYACVYSHHPSSLMLDRTLRLALIVSNRWVGGCSTIKQRYLSDRSSVPRLPRDMIS